jgi:hypothetical protein
MEFPQYKEYGKWGCLAPERWRRNVFLLPSNLPSSPVLISYSAPEALAVSNSLGPPCCQLIIASNAVILLRVFAF